MLACFEHRANDLQGFNHATCCLKFQTCDLHICACNDESVHSFHTFLCKRFCMFLTGLIYVWFSWNQQQAKPKSNADVWSANSIINTRKIEVATMKGMLLTIWSLVKHKINVTNANHNLGPHRLGELHQVQMQCKHNICICWAFNYLASLLVFNIDQATNKASFMQPIIESLTIAFLSFAIAIVNQLIYNIIFIWTCLHWLSKHAHRCEHAQTKLCSQNQYCTCAFTVASMRNESKLSY